MVAGPVETLPLPAGAFLPGVAASSGLLPLPSTAPQALAPSMQALPALATGLGAAVLPMEVDAGSRD
eukprot:11891276-Prorocentrum_lima.AAC.1